MDGLKFGTTVTLPEDASVRSERGLMPLPDGSYIAVQRISSSDLAFLADRVAGGLLTSPEDVLQHP